MPEFDENYVKKLREEAASWRTKCRELEAQSTRNVVEVELAKQGIEADPDWVTVEEGQTAEEAVNGLVAKFPALQKQVTIEPEVELLDLGPEPKPRVAPKVLSPSHPKTTVPKPVRATKITTRNIAEIRKDPVARSKVRDLYRDLIARGSNQPGE